MNLQFFSFSHQTARFSAILIVTTSLNFIGAASASDEPKVGSSSRGATTWAQQCNRCHNMRDPLEFRDDQWRVIVNHMRLRGGMDGQQTRDILAFLQAVNTGYWSQPTITGSAQSTATIAGEAGAANTVRSGHDLYSQACVACHGATGKGSIPGVPDFTAPNGPLAKSDSVLERSILQGVRRDGAPLAMPPQGGDPDVGPMEARVLIEYLRDTFGPSTK